MEQTSAQDNGGRYYNFFRKLPFKRRDFVPLVGWVPYFRRTLKELSSEEPQPPMMKTWDFIKYGLAFTGFVTYHSYAMYYTFEGLKYLVQLLQK